jgi:Domain of unknown function (DUF305)
MNERTTRPVIVVSALAALFLGLTSALPAWAGEHDEHAGHQMPAADTAPLSEASKAFEDAMQKMHKDMAVPYSNDVDVDFVRGMMPHHQGAIDQAEILLKYSKNKRLRLLAGGIIAAQRREIKFMKYWMAEHDKGVETNEMPVWLRADPEAIEKLSEPEAAKPADSNTGGKDSKP